MTTSTTPSPASFVVHFNAVNETYFSRNLTETYIDKSDTNYSEDINKFSWFHVTSLDQCNETHWMFKNHIYDVIIVPYAHIKQDPYFFSVGEYSYEYIKKFVYRECFDLILV